MDRCFSETLVKGNFENGFFTHALAGSKSKNENLKWTEKDYQEHKYVVDFIEKKIKKNGYITKESKIEEKIAGDIIHLNKSFNFSLNIDYLSFVKTLHPTPAIAGIPLDKSLEIIKKFSPKKIKISVVFFCSFTFFLIFFFFFKKKIS